MGSLGGVAAKSHVSHVGTDDNSELPLTPTVVALAPKSFIAVSIWVAYVATFGTVTGGVKRDARSIAAPKA